MSALGYPPSHHIFQIPSAAPLAPPHLISGAMSPLKRGAPKGLLKYMAETMNAKAKAKAKATAKAPAAGPAVSSPAAPSSSAPPPKQTRQKSKPQPQAASAEPSNRSEHEPPAKMPKLTEAEEDQVFDHTFSEVERGMTAAGEEADPDEGDKNHGEEEEDEEEEGENDEEVDPDKQPRANAKSSVQPAGKTASAFAVEEEDEDPDEDADEGEIGTEEKSAAPEVALARRVERPEVPPSNRRRNIVGDGGQKKPAIFCTICKVSSAAQDLPFDRVVVATTRAVTTGSQASERSQ